MQSNTAARADMFEGQLLFVLGYPKVRKQGVVCDYWAEEYAVQHFRFSLLLKVDTDSFVFMDRLLGKMGDLLGLFHPQKHFFLLPKQGQIDADSIIN